ncbi:hypothetical protein ESP57_10145 [Agromyces fucosus]|uniref:Uncharacterized protein n=1 Tax=Agromyces fucosus TaxID=41985 RepID=A0A4Q2JM63_9MICO|nr:hypothetical protein [Agromyces fucosus]RXZ49275.1 hypothetical protein ESP57_10145 [Agromyces fucosus]
MADGTSASERMPRAGRRAVPPLLLAVAAGALLLAGCSAGSGTGTGADTLPAPVVVEIADIEGETIEVVDGNVIDLTGDDETYAEWDAEIEDPSIVEFTPGRDDGSAQFNPGLTALAVGSTAVTLENSETGETVAFTVEVVPVASDY